MLIAFQRITPTVASITTMYYDEADAPDLGDDTVIVSELPEPPAPQVGKYFTMFVNPETSELFYEAFDRELTIEEKYGKLQAETSQIMLALVLNDLI